MDGKESEKDLGQPKTHTQKRGKPPLRNPGMDEEKWCSIWGDFPRDCPLRLRAVLEKPAAPLPHRVNFVTDSPEAGIAQPMCQCYIMFKLSHSHPKPPPTSCCTLLGSDPLDS